MPKGKGYDTGSHRGKITSSSSVSRSGSPFITYNPYPGSNMKGASGPTSAKYGGGMKSSGQKRGGTYPSFAGPGMSAKGTKTK